jgi:hypothetical protein
MAVIKLSMPPSPPICDNKEPYVPSSEGLIQCTSQSARVDLFSINHYCPLHHSPIHQAVLLHQGTLQK